MVVATGPKWPANPINLLSDPLQKEFTHASSKSFILFSPSFISTESLPHLGPALCRSVSLIVLYLLVELTVKEVVNLDFSMIVKPSKATSISICKLDLQYLL